MTKLNRQTSHLKYLISAMVKSFVEKIYLGTAPRLQRQPSERHEKDQPSIVYLERSLGLCQSDKPWSWVKGSIGQTSGMGGGTHEDTNIILNWSDTGNTWTLTSSSTEVTGHMRTLWHHLELKWQGQHMRTLWYHIQLKSQGRHMRTLWHHLELKSQRQHMRTLWHHIQLKSQGRHMRTL